MTEFAAALLVGSTGLENFLALEIEAEGGQVLEKGNGWIRVEGGLGVNRLCFAHWAFQNPACLEGDSVNALTRELSAWFAGFAPDFRPVGEWPVLLLNSNSEPGLGRRLQAVWRSFLERETKRLSGLLKRARPGGAWPTGWLQGLFLWQADYGRILVARQAWCGGQARMQDTPEAPSRSYLKLEEAFHLLGRAPGPGDRVVDLGAAPGGWSLSAARRGARVLAIDNGALRGGAAVHPGIAHVPMDAFRFQPPPDWQNGWLLCDLLETPHRVRECVEHWIGQGWARHWVINFKYGRTDPMRLRAELLNPEAIWSRTGRSSLVRHLFHNREEFTLMGSRGM